MIYMGVSENGVVPPIIAILIGDNKLSKFGASCFQTNLYYGGFYNQVHCRLISSYKLGNISLRLVY